MTDLFKSRAAGPVSIYRPNPAGVLDLVEVRPAGTIETAKLAAEDLRGKRGRKPKGQTEAGERANRFAESENSY